jgi:uncharacterized membrane protein
VGPGACGSTTGADPRVHAAVLSLPAGVRIWLVAGFTDMRRGIDGLAALVQTALSSNPFSGLSAAQLTTLLEGIDWRRMHRGGTPDGDAPSPTLAA